MKGVKKLWIANCKRCGEKYSRATRHNTLCDKCREIAFKERGYHLCLIKYGKRSLNDNK
jgi:hypothetical protein